MRQFLLFCIAGGIGFVVDATVVQALVSLAGGDPYVSRLASFLCAATATWLFNRHYTFAGHRHYSLLGEWARYLLAMSGGFAVNYGTYAALLLAFPLVHQYPVIGVAAGSLAGMAVNYASSRLWIYRRRKDR